MLPGAAAVLLAVAVPSVGALAQPAGPLATATTASTATTGWTARALPLPAGDKADIVLPEATDIGCLPSGSCVTAVNFDGVIGGELAVGGGTSWRAVVPLLPANDLNGPKSGDGSFGAAACGPAKCVAVGAYLAAKGQGLLTETGSGTTWTPDEVPTPAGALQASLNQVACGTTCAAIGTVAISGKGTFPLLELGSGTKWKDSVAAAPKGASKDANLTLTSVSCRAGDCVAAGSYISKTRGVVGVLEVESGGAWKAVQAPLPAGAVASNQDVTLHDVSCATSTFCAAVGTYIGPGRTGQAEFVTGSGAKWAAAKIPVPKGGGGPTPAYVSCPSTSSCTTVGDYVDKSGFGHMMITTKSGKSVTSITAPAPSNALNVGHGQSVLIEGQVRCLSAKLCVTIGAYEDKSIHEHAVVLTGAGSKWTVRELPAPKGAPSNPQAALFWLACPKACDAVGIYEGDNPYLSAGPA